MEQRIIEYEKGGLQKEYYNHDDVALRRCPLCNEANYLSMHKERGAIGVVKCKGCGLIYTNPIVKESEKNYWGDENKYYEEAALIFKGQAAHHRDPNYIEELQFIEKIKSEGNFLDIGTNMGFFLRHAKGKKWNVFGIEPSPTLSEMARKYFELKVKTASLEEANFEEKFFDIVTMIDVFEHVVEPKKILLEVKRIMKDDGILFIKVPNGKYSLLKFWLTKLSNKHQEHDIFDAYEHLVHYTQGTLERMLESCGFKVVKKIICKPIQIPVWHKYVGHYYQYPSPWILDPKNYSLRSVFYWISKFEFLLRFCNIGYFASNISVVAIKIKKS